MNSLIRWMANNHVAANILMIAIVLGGILIAPSIQQEIFPEIELENIIVRIVYSGVGPTEIESSICIPLEKTILEVSEIEKITCTSSQDLASLNLELVEGTNKQDVLDLVKTAIDNTELPEDIETPAAYIPQRLRNVMSLMLSGGASEWELLEIGELVKKEIEELVEVTRVEMIGAQKKEIRIEVSPDFLLKNKLTLQDISNIIQKYTKDQSSGKLNLTNQQILLKTLSKRETAQMFSQIPILKSSLNSNIYLGDIATITEKLEDKNRLFLLDSKPAIRFNVDQSESFTPAQASKKITAYIEEFNQKYPKNSQLFIWEDRSEMFKSRFDLLLNNAWTGLLLVFFFLALFLEIRLAFWVVLGIPISFLGSLILISFFDVTINMISMFGFILVMGIVVDDAIVIGENIFQHYEKGKSALNASIKGCLEMAQPIAFSTITTIVAFAPLLFVEGRMGSFISVIAVVVICVILFSLVESLLILPAHLSSERKPLSGILKYFEYCRKKCDQFIQWLLEKSFHNTLKYALIYRYTTISIGLVFLILSVGLVTSSLVKVVFFPSIEGDSVTVSIELPAESSVQSILKKIQVIEKKGLSLIGEIDEQANNGIKSMKYIYTDIQEASDTSGSANAVISMIFHEEDKRNISTTEFKRIWQEQIRTIAGIESVQFSSRGPSFGNDIEINISHQDSRILTTANLEVQNILSSYAGVSDIKSTKKDGARTLQFTLKPKANLLGVTPFYLAQELKGISKGIEVLTLQRSLEEVPVNLSYPKKYQKTISQIEEVKIITPTNVEVPVKEIAEIFIGSEPISIKRVNQKAVFEVTASVDEKKANLGQILRTFQNKEIPKLQGKFPQLLVEQKGSKEERDKSLNSLKKGLFFALFIIYGLLAILFRSYFQPLIVMLAIPFGIAGAIIGHLVTGHALSFLSLFGLLGLIGVVVNDSLILIDSINKKRTQTSKMLINIILESAKSRFRPIVLTSITTFAGLFPILLETSVQAQYLIPMAISLGVGILFATFITLLLIPAFYLIVEDIKNIFATPK